MLRKQAEFKELIEQGKFIEEYVGKEVLKEGSPIIILEGYERFAQSFEKMLLMAREKEGRGGIIDAEERQKL